MRMPSAVPLGASVPRRRRSVRPGSSFLLIDINVVQSGTFSQSGRQSGPRRHWPRQRHRHRKVHLASHVVAVTHRDRDDVQPTNANRGSRLDRLQMTISSHKFEKSACALSLDVLTPNMLVKRAPNSVPKIPAPLKSDIKSAKCLPRQVGTELQQELEEA